MGYASSLFNGARPDTLIGRVSPTQDQREFLQASWNDLAEHLKTSLKAKHGYPISTWLQGSYKYGTLIKPIHANEEYDVDLGVYFEWGDADSDQPSPTQLRQWVQSELLDCREQFAQIRSVVDPPKERCSRASYERQFHIDIPVYHLNPEKDERRLACLSGGWETSDPKAFYKWFRDVLAGSQREQMRRVIRYLKAWAALSFDDVPDSRPSSIFLTALAAESYRDIGLPLTLGIDDDDALVSVIESMHERLSRDRRVFNPATKDYEDLNRMTDGSWDAFLPRLDALLDVANRAEVSEDEASAALVWTEAFTFLMPLPDTHEVELHDDENSQAVMRVPDVDVEVFEGSGTGRRFVAVHNNRVAGVARGCTLIFSIANPNLLPVGATVEWTVRNEGEEADASSDLGHRKVGVATLRVEEAARYVGTHHMDCAIRVDGHVQAVRRIPVTVNERQNRVDSWLWFKRKKLSIKRRR